VKVKIEIREELTIVSRGQKGGGAIVFHSHQDGDKRSKDQEKTKINQTALRTQGGGNETQMHPNRTQSCLKAGGKSRE